MMTNLFQWDTLRKIGEIRFLRITFLSPFLPIFIIVVSHLCNLLNPVSSVLSKILYQYFWILVSIYYGSILIAIASLLYILKCPVLVRTYHDYLSYFFTEHKLVTENYKSLIISEINSHHKKLMSISDIEILKQSPAVVNFADLARIHYQVISITSIKMRMACGILYSIGFALIFFPSVIKFIKVSQEVLISSVK